MSVVARRTPRLGPFDRRAAIIAIAVAAFLVLGGGGFFLVSNLVSGAGHGTSGGGPAATLPSASPTVSASPAATPAPTAAAPPSAVAGLNCTIAVAGAWASGSGGFLHFPGGVFTPDPSSAVQTPDGGFYGLTHVLALNRWVAVPRAWVAPEGTRYVYLGGDWSGPSLRLVSANNTVSALPVPTMMTASGARQNLNWRLLSAEADGVYLGTDGWAGIPGLYRVGYDGQARRIAADGFWQAVGYGFAYGTVTAVVPDGAANTIFRQSLATGVRDDLFSAPGLASTVVGFDAGGNAVVEASSSTMVEVWLATPAPINPVKLLSWPIQTPPGGMGPAQPRPPHVYSAIGDDHGLWLATTKGLYLYTPQTGLEAASTVAGPLGSTCR